MQPLPSSRAVTSGLLLFACGEMVPHSKLGVVVHFFNPGTQEESSGKSSSPGQPGPLKVPGNAGKYRAGIHRATLCSKTAPGICSAPALHTKETYSFRGHLSDGISQRLRPVILAHSLHVRVWQPHYLVTGPERALLNGKWNWSLAAHIASVHLV